MELLNKDVYCQSSVYKNFGLTGLLLPELKSPKIKECQNMKYNCCTETDIMRLQDQWEDKYSKYVEFNHYYFSFYIRELLRYDSVYKQKAVFVKEQNDYPLCQNAAKLILNFEFPEDFEETVNSLLKKVYDFDLALKKGFTCFLCDFDNAKHIDIETKSVFLNVDVCDGILMHTYEFQRFFNK